MKGFKKTLVFLLVAVIVACGLMVQVGAAPGDEIIAEYVTFTSSTTENMRTDFQGWVGVSITVGAQDIVVTDIGRLFLAGNTLAHGAAIIDVATPSVLAQVEIPAGGTDGKFTYAALANRVTLEAGKTYYIVTMQGTDKWCGQYADVSFANVATVNGPVYSADGAAYGVDPIDTANGGKGIYGPVSFKYVAGTEQEPGSSSEQSPSSEQNPSSAAVEKVDAPFITSVQVGTPRNNYGGFVGIQLTVGNKPITVKALGRMFLDGNMQRHTVKAVDAASGEAVASVVVSGGTNGKFTYENLTEPVVLGAGKVYYIVSEEFMDGDFWYHNDSTLAYMPIGIIDSAIFQYEGVWNQEGLVNEGFGPTNFIYEADKDTIVNSTPATGNTQNSIWGYVAVMGVLIAAAVVLLMSKKNPQKAV